MVTMFIMILLTLIVLGFAHISRREQRQSLDTQLNTQAFYAAESGINDAITKLKALSLTDPTGILQTNYTECNPPNSFASSTNAKLNSEVDGTNITYSCLLVNPKPASLVYGNIDQVPHVIPIVAATGNISTITINWQAKDGTADFNCPGSGGYPDLAPAGSSPGDWTCATGLLRADIVPVDTVSRGVLNANLRTLFLYPRPNPPASYTIGSATGQIVGAKCSVAATPRYCGVSLDVTTFGSGKFYMRLSSLYKASSVVITAQNGAATPVELTGAQAVIDSTGKANDILRRVQVRVSLNALGNGPFPSAAIQSGDTICKLLDVLPGSVSTSSLGDTACAIN